MYLARPLSRCSCYCTLYMQRMARNLPVTCVSTLNICGGAVVVVPALLIGNVVAFTENCLTEDGSHRHENKPQERAGQDSNGEKN